MNPFQPSNELLHAYLDQQLDEPTRLAVEAYLASHPDTAAQVAGWRQDAQHLRAALANLEHLPGNPRLDPQAIRQRRRHGQRRLLATAAALILAVGIGGVGGWQARSQNLLAANPPMQDALEAHRLFALGPNQAVDLQPRDTAALQGWLDQHFQHASRLPDMQAYGLRTVGARLLATEQGPAALLLFEDAQGQRTSLYLRSPGSLYAQMPNGARADGELQARYWSQSGYNYALVSERNDPHSEPLQKALTL